MAAVSEPSAHPPAKLGEQRMLIHGVTWKDYVILREALDTPGLRMTYCEGALELRTTSRKQQLHKHTIARLIETYATLRRLPLIGYGSTTFRREAKARGAEPDECWCVGREMEDEQFPDIVLEVIHTNPLLDKLQVYAGFGVREVWLFEDGAFELHAFDGAAYARVDHSALLPELDFAMLAPLAVRTDQHEAVAELVQRLGPR